MMKKTKRLAAFTIALMCILAFMPMVPAGIVAGGQAQAASKVKYMSFSTNPTMNSIELKWKKKKGIKYYVIYKKDVTKIVDPTSGDNDATLKMSQYKKIKTVKAGKKKFTYTDKKVKKHHYYAYVIKAYKANKKLAYSSYDNGSFEYACPGLAAPTLLNDGSGEFHTNTNKRFYFWCMPEVTSIEPADTILYRKAAGEKKYKRIGSFKAKNATLSDSSVKKGKTYYYKAKTRIKYRGKYYYSKSSNVVRIENGNLTGYFTIDIINNDESALTRTIKMTSDKLNGTLTIKSPLVYFPEDDEINETGENIVEIAQYSTDGTTWKSMSKSIKLAPGKSVWLKLTGKNVTSASKYVCDEGFADYSAPWIGFTKFTFDFANKKAAAEYTYYDD